MSWEPRYLGRVVRIPLLGDWKDLFARWAYGTYLSRNSVLAGFTTRLDVQDCRDVACKVERARNLVDRMTSYAGVGEWSITRRATEMIESRQSNAFERAVMMKVLLDGANVSSLLGAYTAPFSHRIDADFPSLEQLNRPILFIQQQRTLPEPLWVDPTCSACALGQVSDEALGSWARLMQQKGYDELGRPQMEAYGAVINGVPFIRSGVTKTLVATVMLGGDVLFEHRDERAGAIALDVCQAGEDDDDDGPPPSISPTLELTSFEPQRCEPQRAFAASSYKAVLPDHAYADGRALYVPLTLLDPDWAVVFEGGARVLPVAFTAQTRREYKLVLTVPQGFKLEGKKKTEVSAAQGLRAELTVSPTPAGADVSLVVDMTPGMYAPASYAQLRSVTEFIRGARARALKFVKR